MKLSVIIPVYNVEEYVIRCINSVIQNDLESSVYEIIIVDDASPDDSVKIIQSHFQEVANLKIISQKNKGLGGARNTGISHAKGTFLLFLDADDYLVPNTLNQIVNQAIANQLDVLEFGAQGVLENGTICYTLSNSSNSLVLDGMDYYQKVRYANSACNKLYKTEFLKENQLFFEEQLYIEDFEFNTRVFLHAKRMLAVETIVGQFLQSPNSITRNVSLSKKEKMQNDIERVMVITNKMYLKSSNQHAFFKERLGFLTATLIVQMIRNHSDYKTIHSKIEDLKTKKLFFVNHPLFDRSKNLFRILFLKQLVLLKIVLPLYQFLKNKH
jgi:glycosyltransferase involved in cell wall biosynthesis